MLSSPAVCRNAQHETACSKTSHYSSQLLSQGAHSTAGTDAIASLAACMRLSLASSDRGQRRGETRYVFRQTQHDAGGVFTDGPWSIGTHDPTF